MIKNKLFWILGLMVICFTFSKDAFAGGFNLKSIGQVDTSGRQISQWWYSGSQPVFVGEATPGASVSITIDGTEGTAIADESGNWSYAAAALSDGDHQVMLASSGSTISFTLTTGVSNVNWDAVNSDAGTSTLPTAGIIWPGLLLLMTGFGSAVAGGKMIRASKK